MCKNHSSVKWSTQIFKFGWRDKKYLFKYVTNKYVCIRQVSSVQVCRNVKNNFLDYNKNLCEWQSNPKTPLKPFA